MRMLNEHVAEILRDLDAVECDMRRLEHRLTRIRRRLHEAIGGSQLSRWEVNGQRRGQPTSAASIPETSA